MSPAVAGVGSVFFRSTNYIKGTSRSINRAGNHKSGGPGALPVLNVA
jgi:hypothetical protein